MLPQSRADLVKLVMNMGAFGAILLIVYWVFMFGFPQFVQTLTAQRQEFRDELKLVRDEHRADNNKLGAAIDTLSRAVNDNTQAVREVTGGSRRFPPSP